MDIKLCCSLLGFANTSNAVRSCLPQKASDHFGCLSRQGRSCGDRFWPIVFQMKTFMCFAWWNTPVATTLEPRNMWSSSQPHEIALCMISPRNFSMNTWICPNHTSCTSFAKSTSTKLKLIKNVLQHTHYYFTFASCSFLHEVCLQCIDVTLYKP